MPHKKKGYRDRLFVKQAKLATVVALLLGIAFSLTQILFDLSNEKREIGQKLDQVLALTLASAAQAAYTLDSQIAQTVISGLTKQSYIIQVDLHSNFNEMLATSKGAESTGSMAFIANKVLGSDLVRGTDLYVPEIETSVGRLTLYADSYRIAANFFQRSGLILFTGLIRNLIFAGIIVWIFFQTLTKPLLSIIEQLSDIDVKAPARKKLFVPDGYEETELGQLADTFNGMAELTAMYLSELNTTATDLRKSETHLRTLLETLPDLVWLKDPNGVYLDCNKKFEGLFGANRSEIIGRTDYDFIDKDLADTLREHDAAAISAGRPTANEELAAFVDDGHEELLETIKTPVCSADGELIGVLGVGRDITDRRKNEKALRRAQKMDAVGQMAGGIAHDFNNILGIIIGNVNLLERHVSSDQKALKRIGTIKKSAHRAADLTKQLLGFSRQQPTQMAITDINQAIDEMDSLIVRSITPEVVVERQFEPKLWLTEIDVGDFQDALLNLILNARDAMPAGGQLILKTCNCTLDATYCAQNHGAVPGEYVQLMISDSGVGIPVKHQEKIFDPFFTTKAQGKGTGLGLAMVFGFVNRSNGSISVYSELGVGTVFRLYLPRSGGEEQPLKVVDEQPERLPRGNEIVLAVDDEVGLLDLAKESLQALGYRVITASDGTQALDRLAEEPAISLLFSDVVMPGGISGYELAEKATNRLPNLKVLLTSGYTEKAVAHNGQARFNAQLLSKPYTQAELAQHIRLLLGDNDIKNPGQSNAVSWSKTSVLDLVRWVDDFKIGVHAIDEDHRKLFDLAARCHQLAEESDNQKEVAAILKELLDYVSTHFQREEVVMEECGYPGLLNHKQVHKLLIKPVEIEIEHFEQGQMSIQRITSFLNSWLVDHIQGMDQAFAPYCEGKEESIKKALEKLESTQGEDSSQ